MGFGEAQLAAHDVGAFDEGHAFVIGDAARQPLAPETAIGGDDQLLARDVFERLLDEGGDVLDAFIAGLGMPRSLGAVNIGAENFDLMAEQAMGTPWVPRNPRSIAGPAQVCEILELAA